MTLTYINTPSYSSHVSCHDYEGVMSVLCTPLQVKCKEGKLCKACWVLSISMKTVVINLTN